MFAFVVFEFSSTKPRDWLGRTYSKWPILCRVGLKTLTQSITLLFWTLWTISIKDVDRHGGNVLQIENVHQYLMYLPINLAIMHFKLF